MSNIDTRGRAVYSLAPQYLPAQQSAFSSAIGQMSQLVQRYAVDAQKESMAEAGRAANNDIINNTINPDRVMHEIAYSKSLAKGQALQSYGSEKNKISAGEYNEMDPEKYQAMLRDKHRGFTAGNAENPFASDMNAEYNDFWLKNEPALTAAQAGAWRVTMGAKQSEAMNKALREQAKIDAENKKVQAQKQSFEYSQEFSKIADSGTNLKAFKDTIESEEYTLLDQNTRLMTALAAAGRVGEETGDTTLLYYLKDEYGLDTAPGFKDVYQAHERKTNRKQSAVTKKMALDTLVALDNEVARGTLSLDMYPQVENLKDEDGNSVMTFRGFNELYRQSQKNAMGNAVVRHQRDSFITGVPFQGSNKELNHLADQEMEGLYEKHNGDTELVLEQMGIYMAPQNKVWDKMKSLGTNFSKMKMLDAKGEINPQAVDTFKNLQAFKKGLNTALEGESVFTAHVSTESLALFNEIEIMAQTTRGTIEDVWKSISETREMREYTSYKLNEYNDLTSGERQKFTDIVQTAFDALDSSGNIFAVFRRARNGEQDLRQAIGVASRVYEEAISTGASEEAATRTATQKVADAFKLFNGKMVYTGGIPLQKLFGGEEPKDVVKALVEDPEYQQDLAALFTKEGFFHRSDPMKKAITPGEVTAAKVRKEYNEPKLDKKAMAEGTTIDLKNGLIVFMNPDSTDRRQFTIPLKVAGEISAAKRAKIEDLANLDRFYSSPFNNTNNGRKLLAGYADANAYFMKSIDNGIIETEITAEEYTELTPLEQTRKRLEFHEENYRGAMGVLKMTRDYFKMVRDIDTKSEDFLKVKETPISGAGLLFKKGEPPESFGKRPDGTDKGPGFLGVLKRPDGKVSTEISIGVTIDGKEMEIPTLVPTLTKKQVDHLLSGKPPTKTIVDKAVAYAGQRLRNGDSPFYTQGETLKESLGNRTVVIKKGAGVKNNNPGNLRYAGQQGATGERGKGFAKFKTPREGFQALERQIALEASRGHTLESFVNKFAPNNENDTKRYLDFMKKTLGVSGSVKLTTMNLFDIAKAVAKFESGTVVR